MERERVCLEGEMEVGEEVAELSGDEGRDIVRGLQPWLSYDSKFCLGLHPYLKIIFVYHRGFGNNCGGISCNIFFKYLCALPPQFSH